MGFPLKLGQVNTQRTRLSLVCNVNDFEILFLSFGVHHWRNGPMEHLIDDGIELWVLGLLLKIFSSLDIL